MFTENYDMQALFDQLGLDSSKAGIDAFVASHPLREGVRLQDASFWNPAQARFLHEELERDAGWAPVVDDLSARLRCTADPQNC